MALHRTPEPHSTARRRPGRPRALDTDEELEWLLAALATGMPHKVIRWRLRIAKSTLYRYCRYLARWRPSFWDLSGIERSAPAEIDRGHACGSTSRIRA